MKNIHHLVGLGAICIAALASTACHKHSYDVGSGGNVDAEPAKDMWASHWFFGTIGETHIDVKEVCPSGNATIKDKRSFLNGLVAGVTGIVWSPSTVTIWCGGGGESADAEESQGQAVSIRLTPEETKAIATDQRTIEWARTVSPEAAQQLATIARGDSPRDAQVAEASAPTTF